MILTSCQEKAMKMITTLMSKDGYGVAVLAGFSGTGKTTLLKMVAEKYGVPLIVCPTGKASARVFEATRLPAQTVHRWMYKATVDTKTGEIDFVRLAPDALSTGECELVVVDEASMVNKDLWNDISDTCRILGLRILLVGDGAQLPPVQNDDKDEWSLLNPDDSHADLYVQMETIVRQALDNPIIKASMLIRGGDPMAGLALLKIVPFGGFVDKAAEISSGGGMVICHTNATRFWLNEKIRLKMGRGESISEGEPVMVLKNNAKLGIYNGETYTFNGWTDVSSTQHKVYDKFSKIKELSRFGIAKLEGNGSEIKAVMAEEQLFGRLKSRPSAIEEGAKILYKDHPVAQCNLGYCSTAHKSQGAEAPEVLVTIEPTVRFWGDNKLDALRWLYTAVSRSKDVCYYSMGVCAPKGLAKP